MRFDDMDLEQYNSVLDMHAFIFDNNGNDEDNDDSSNGHERNKCLIYISVAQLVVLSYSMDLYFGNSVSSFQILR
ncbi:hypothetical protein Glove_13g101 [Diversispora epigaea]|uniref:Uncharacterized protein n=1 Tax=Diversispora epigaea TaxID=1348612 RepID=A0A397JMS4_9GLOM|nr:hypothetical protein Glove_13g101 [Diversispora epigaea]